MDRYSLYKMAGNRGQKDLTLLYILDLRLWVIIVHVVLYLPPDLFDNYMQQDAHEFLNYLLNTVADILQEEKKQERQNGRLKNNGTAVTTETETENKTEPTWVHDIFQGTLTNETRCLNCETVSVPALFYGVLLDG